MAGVEPEATDDELEKCCNYERFRCFAYGILELRNETSLSLYNNDDTLLLRYNMLCDEVENAQLATCVLKAII